MAIFAINEGSFELPDDWEDKSVTAISFPSGSKVPAASITVTREMIKDKKETLSSYVNGQLVNLAKTCPAFQLVRHIPAKLNGLLAESVEFTWKTPEKIAVRQLMVVTFVKSHSLVITSTAAAERFAEFQPVFEAVIASFRVREP